MLRALAVTLCLVATSSSVAEQHDGFQPLFDGQSIDDWVQRGGKAMYTVAPEAVGGAQIVGTSVANTGNSFLCPPRDYSDFILELEVKVDPTLNSGIQFRSECFDEDKTVTIKDEQDESKKINIKAGRVHGYQAEIDPSDRGWSAGVYDEGRRGWLYKLEGDEHAAAGAAFDPTGWNKYRIEAIGDSIKTFINGVPAADFEDDMTAEGFIALQVHGVSQPEQVGRQVRWRNIRIKEVSK